MVDITVELTGVDDKDIDDIVNSCEILGNDVKINISVPWPKLELGDRFIYSSIEYAFLSYHDKYEIRAVTMDALLNDAIIQPVYFNCEKKQAHMKFIFRK